MGNLLNFVGVFVFGIGIGYVLRDVITAAILKLKDYIRPPI